MKTINKFSLVFAALALILVSGCGKSGKSNSNSNLYGNGYNGYGQNSTGTVGAVGNDSYGRFTLGLRIGSNGQGSSGTLLATQPLGCSTGYASVGLPAGASVNLAPAQAGQVTQYGQIYNLAVGANTGNMSVVVVVQNATIQALAGGRNTCLGGTQNELFGMIQIIFQTPQGSCTVPAYIDLQSMTPAGC